MPGINGTSIEIAQSDQELVGSKRKSNIKKLVLGGGVAVIVIALIVVAVVLLNKSDDNEPAQDREALALEDILEGRFSTKKFNGTWISDNEILFRDFSSSDVIVFDVQTKTQKVLLGTENESLAQGFKFVISPDQKYLLVGREYQKIFRHSYAALYDIVDLQTNQVTPVQVNNQQQPIIYADWSPIGNALIFVFQNDIYYKSNPLAAEIRITTDGDRSIYNGVPDWVYEEEIFASNKANWISPDGTKLAYIHFDDTPTHLMNIPVYGPPGSLEFQYTRQFGIHYPKAGTNNPIVKLFYVDLSTLQPGSAVNRQEIQAPTELPLPGNQIISSVEFANNSTLIAVWMNRVQNNAYIQACQGVSCKIIKHLESTTGWVEFFTAPIFNKDGSKMAIIASQAQGSAGDYRHLTVVSTVDGTTEALTSGKHVVTEILTWDEETDLIFYLANTEADSHVSNLYAKRTDLSNVTPICVTCDIRTNCVKQTYFSADIRSSNMALISLGPSVPRAELFSWTWNNNEIKLTSIMDWEVNADVNESLNAKHGPTILFHDIEITPEFTAKVQMQLPHNADLSGATKYPMLVDVYAGPDSVAVSDKWALDWGSYMATNQSVIYARIDGRGSGVRGDRILHAIYRKLGTFEVADQITTAEKLALKLPYIDADRMGIWGWSYGGYASAMALATQNSSVFKCAASVAPVTDWTYYDSIYTERYMGLPTETDNKAAYDASRLSTMAENIRGKKFLLVHGTLDDNVHYQQAMALARTLEKDDILFKQISYPDEDHGLAGVRPHLYHSLGNFFGDCFHLKAGTY